MLEKRHDTLDRLIKERWTNSFSILNYKYIASYYLDGYSFDGKKVLDIGCGSGLLLSTICLISNPRLAVGLDNFKGEGSPVSDYDFIKKTRMALSFPNLKIVNADARLLPFHKNSFDMIYTSHCLHHIYASRVPLKKAEEKEKLELINLLREVYNSLSDNGTFVVAEVPKYTMLRFAKLFGFFKTTNFVTKQEPGDWMDALEKAGFKNFTLKFHTPYPARFFRKILSNKIGRYLICGQYYIFAKKK